MLTIDESMQSYRTYLVFRKIANFSIKLTSLWLLLIVIIFLKNQVFESNSRNLYETSLSNLGSMQVSTHKSQFRVWEHVPIAHSHLSKEEQINVLRYHKKGEQPGANGEPVVLKVNLPLNIQERIRDGWRLYHFNSFVSDLIPANRTLPDARNKWCRKQNYSSDLPSITVIICFNNEAWSTLIRTITSVLNRTPSHLLDEIILVDDDSDFEHLQKGLDDYVSSMPKVRLIRAPYRLGLMRSRMLPIQEVKSSVIVFLDSHCECTAGWLEPLLQRIKDNPSTVVSPSVDHIHDNTFRYIQQDETTLRVGGFNWDLQFNWIQVPQNVLETRNESLAPIQTATISGGLFAISKDFFKKLGMYDPGMDIWGAENLELSFKTWMCGGRLEIVPCSHVGHVFKLKSTFMLEDEALKKNFVRLARVWLDTYAKYFYERIGFDLGDYGDVSERVQLRANLRCHTFQWYLENVIPEQIIPDNFVASGPIQTKDREELCLDAQVPFPKFEAVDIYPCHGQGGNQYWAYTSSGEIRRDDLCLDYLYDTITLFFCNHAASQVWLYFEEDQIIVHNMTLRCLNKREYYNVYKPVLSKCYASPTQKWTMTNFKVGKLALNLQLATKVYIHLRRKKIKEAKEMLNKRNLNMTTSKKDADSLAIKVEKFDSIVKRN